MPSPARCGKLSPMNRARHVLQVLCSLALALVPTWVDEQIPLAGKISATIAMALALYVEPKFQLEVWNMVVGVCTVAGVVLTIVLGKIPADTSWALGIGTAVAVASNLRTALGVRPKVAPALPEPPT